MKVNATPDHPTQTINVGRKLKNSKGDLDPIAPRPPVIDTSLKDMIRDGDELLKRKAIVEGHCHTYDGRMTVFVDWFKKIAGNASLHVPLIAYTEAAG